MMLTNTSLRLFSLATLLAGLIISTNTMAMPVEDGEENRGDDLPLFLEDISGFASFNDLRGGFEIGNHKWIENLTGFYKFTVYKRWQASYNDVFTEVASQDEETSIEVSVEKDISFRQVSEYVQYMMARGWKPISTIGGLKGVRRDHRFEEGIVETDVRLYREPGETVVFRIASDEEGQSGVREVNRVLNTFELIPRADSVENAKN